MLTLFGGKYRTLNTIRIHGKSLHHNLNFFRKQWAGKAICPVLKANAYGHGLVPTATLLEEEQPEFLIVDSLYEAYELQKAHIGTPILILGYTFPENLTRKKLPFHFAVAEQETLETLSKQKASIHLKIDTGMNRMGFSLEELPAVLKRLIELPLKVEGVFTHLADVENLKDPSYTLQQLKRFREALDLIHRAGFKPKWKHAGGASGGALTHELEDMNMMRLGLSLYGVSPLAFTDAQHARVKGLQPVMEVVSTLVGIRSLQTGDKVSYNGTFTAKKTMTVGNIPFGYYEGLPRSLSNKGSVEVQGVQCPIVGRICMNYTTIDLTGVNAEIGDPVTVYSKNPNDPNSFQAVAEQVGTIPYELMVRLAQSIRREGLDQ